MTVLVGYVPNALGEAALTAAVEEARRRGEPLLVVNMSRDDVLVDARRAGEEQLARVGRDLAELGARFEVRQVEEGNDAADALLGLAGQEGSRSSSSGCVTARRSASCCSAPSPSACCSTPPARCWPSRRPERRRLRCETQSARRASSGGAAGAAMVSMTTSTTSTPGPLSAAAAPVTVGIGPVSFDDVVAVARHDATVTISDESLAEVRRTRAVIEALADDAEPHYGVSTGFGALATRHIPVELRAQLQRSLVRSHAAGSGAEVEREVIRALMLLRLSTLATGRTGIRAETLRTYAAMLNAGITPVVHEYGSLGCSGDLAPLVALRPGRSWGRACVRDARRRAHADAAQALAAAGITPVELREKEGLALINGTDGMLGMLVLAITDLRRLLRVADITAAMSVEGQLGTDAVFAADLHALRPQPGPGSCRPRTSASCMQDSEIREQPSHRGLHARAGRLLAALLPAGGGRRPGHAGVCRAGRGLRARLRGRQPRGHPGRTGRVERQLPRRPGRYVLDFLAIVAADLASISERRTDRFLDATRSHGLTAFLADDPGVDSGHMIAQYTQAAIVSELKRLAVPASVDSIPSSAMQEDHVSMGWSAARKLRRAVDGLTRVLAIELLTAARAIDLRAPLQPAAGDRRRARRAARGGRPGPARPLPRPRDRDRGAAGRHRRAVTAAEAVTGPLA